MAVNPHVPVSRPAVPLVGVVVGHPYSFNGVVYARNLMHHSTGWYVESSGGQSGWFDVDAWGNLKLGANTPLSGVVGKIISQGGWGRPATADPFATNIWRRWILKFDGTATLRSFSPLTSATLISSLGNNRYLFDFGSFGCGEDTKLSVMTLFLTNINPADPPRNVTLCREVDEDKLISDPLTDEFCETWRGIHCLRWLDPIGNNAEAGYADPDGLANSGDEFSYPRNAYLEHWSDRPTLVSGPHCPSTWDCLANYNQAESNLTGASSKSSYAFIPFEVLVYASNKTKADLWIPHAESWDDDFVTNLASLVHSTLDQDLRVYLELGNETWSNVTFYGKKYLMAKEAETWPTLMPQYAGSGASTSKWPSGIGYSAYGGKAYAAKRIYEMYEIWRREFAGEEWRLIRLIEGQNSVPSLWTGDWLGGINFVEQQLGYDIKNNIDGAGAATYTGTFLWSSWSSWDSYVLRSEQEFSDNFNAVSIPTAKANHGTHLTTFRAIFPQAKLHQYEGGWMINPEGQSPWSFSSWPIPPRLQWNAIRTGLLAQQDAGRFFFDSFSALANADADQSNIGLYCHFNHAGRHWGPSISQTAEVWPARSNYFAGADRPDLSRPSVYLGIMDACNTRIAPSETVSNSGWSTQNGIPLERCIGGRYPVPNRTMWANAAAQCRVKMTNGIRDRYAGQMTYKRPLTIRVKAQGTAGHTLTTKVYDGDTLIATYADNLVPGAAWFEHTLSALQQQALSYQPDVRLDISVN